MAESIITNVVIFLMILTAIGVVWIFIIGLSFGAAFVFTPISEEEEAQAKSGYYMVKFDGDDFYDEPDATSYVTVNGQRRLD